MCFVNLKKFMISTYFLLCDHCCMCSSAKFSCFCRLLTSTIIRLFYIISNLAFRISFWFFNEDILRSLSISCCIKIIDRSSDIQKSMFTENQFRKILKNIAWFCVLTWFKMFSIIIVLNKNYCYALSIFSSNNKYLIITAERSFLTEK